MENKNDTFEKREAVYAELKKLGLDKRPATNPAEHDLIKKYNELDSLLEREAHAEATYALED